MSKETQKEVDLMNKSFGGLYGDVGELTDPPTTDPAAATDAPSTDAPTTDAPSTDAPITEVSTTDAPATDAPTTEVPDERDQTIIDLRAKLVEKESKETLLTTAPTTLAPLELESQDFIGDADVESITGSKEELNKLLNAVYSKGVTDSRKIVSEGVTKTIPSLVTSQIDMATQMKEISDKFFSENEDLKPFKRVVGVVFEELAAKDPTKAYGEVIKDVAPEVRKRLELHKQTTKSNDKGNSPKLPRKKGKSGRTTETPKPSPIESELDEMNEVLGR